MDKNLKKEKTILVVDDDAGQRSLFISFLSREDFSVDMASTGKGALEILGSKNIAMMITDVRMPGMSGLELLNKSREINPALPVLVVTAFPDIRDAVGAVKGGAVNYLQKPIDLDELLESVQNALGIKPFPIEEEDKNLSLPEGIIAKSPQIRGVFKEAVFVAESESRILITGESGCGKEIVADLVHLKSRRARGPLVKINCAAVPETLLESELFGHEKGSFTGAANRRIGRFEEANGGTILLDEIAEMSPMLQAKLLRITQDGTFYRVGSNEEQRTDARILASTNKNLEKEVEQGRFREDLFYRLNVFEIYVPALRERPEDIMPLAEYYAKKFGREKPRFAPSVTESLKQYQWHGNVRELRNAMERAALLCRGGIILPEHLPTRIREGLKEPEGGEESAPGGKTMEDVERTAILEALAQNDYNRTLTARALGISRRALLYKLKRYKHQGHKIDP